MREDDPPVQDQPMFPVPAEPDSLTVHDLVEEGDKEKRLQVRGKIEQFESELQGFCEEVYGDSGGIVDEINEGGLKEYFLDDGVYIRELFIPKGSIITTQLWKRDRFWIIAYGDVTFRSELGVQRVRGPHRQVAPYGSKVALVTHEDTLWFAISATEASEGEEVKGDVIAQSYEDCIYPWNEGEEQ